MTYLRERKNAFVYAFTGLFQSFKRETHMQIHLVASIFVVTAGFYFSLNNSEWIAIIGCIVLVMVTEILNSAIEKVCDLITLERNETIKYVKDISAAAVLIACIAAVIVAVIIFYPRLS